MRRVVLLSIAVLMALVLMAVKPAEKTHQAVVRATLDNGLRVVIVRDPLAPVVTVEQNYLVGGNETPRICKKICHQYVPELAGTVSICTRGSTG